MAEMKVFVINLDEQEKDTGCAWFTCTTQFPHGPDFVSTVENQ